MHILELDSFKLSDAVKFHNRLNPKIWGRDEHLLPEVREKLEAIADNFREFLGVENLAVRDITVSGSNAAYSYTPHSDLDLHLVVEFPQNDEIYQELFNAKKYQYNDEHNLAIGGVPVELYVQNAAESPVSQGEYSILRNRWIQVPRRKRARIDDTCVQAKVEDLDARIHNAIKSGDADTMGKLWDKIKAMRQSGLDQHGEFGCENIVFKILRNKGCIKDLRTARTAAQDRELSLKEQNRPHTRKVWGFAEGHQGQPYSSEDGVAPSTCMFLNEDDTEDMVQQFIKDTAQRLGIEHLPEIQLHDDDAWSEQNHSFGMYVPEQHVLHVNLRNRHIMDILRTTAHELAHCRQHELEQLDDTAGDTGSPVENEAHAVAGIIMRDFADAHPELFGHEAISESSGYIPTWAERNDPRFEMALSVDVHPGQTGHEANKMRLVTDAQGHPQLARPDGKISLSESLAREFTVFSEGKSYGYNSTPLSQVPGEREDELGNQEATGPEFPPQMPAGTTKIDVSDLTDWYQLGQDISDLDDANPEDYGKGPPQTVVVFPSDEAEQGYLKQFKRLGLKTHDMDPDVKGGEDIKGKHLKNSVAEADRRGVLKAIGAGAAAAAVPGLAKAGDFVDVRALAQTDKEQVEKVWEPRYQELTQRCNDIMRKLIAAAGPQWAPQLKGTRIRVVTNENYAQASALTRTITLDLSVFWDAPDAALAFAIGHELGHVALDHGGTGDMDDASDAVKLKLATQSRQDELDADEFAVRVCKVLGYNKAEIFKFLTKNEDEYRQLELLTQSPMSTHPSHKARIDRAKMNGFQLSKGGIQQINALKTHLAEENIIEELRHELLVLEDEFLGEIRMSPSNLRAEAAKTGAQAGMEFEMIVPGVSTEDDEPEPDYDSDERCRSIEDAVQFFHDGDYNGRREVERLRESMEEDWNQWLYEKIDEDWDRDPEEHIYQYLVDNVDPATIGEIIGEDLSDADSVTKEQVAQAAAMVNDNEQQPYYDDARDWHRSETDGAWDESDWLDENDLDMMSNIENAYQITWPHWTTSNEGEADVDAIADDFSNSIGKPVNASQSYHGARREPGHYVVEPDGSLEGDNPGDAGLEFVSPPMPIDEMMSDLNKVKAWADREGCYTNDSTGLHINISVPNFSIEKLDYVKLALLLGDKYILDQYGRAGNTYTKSALDKVQQKVKSQPDTAKALLDKMRSGMEDLASKAIHSGSTDKYTSINTKSGYIEFRSPGGDWLNENFDKIENTLLRFTVALSAAMDPQAYREEYLKKLYKLLEPTAVETSPDTIRYFADYVAGKTPRAALRSFIKQAQLQRRVKRGETGDQPMWWRVSNPQHSHGEIEVVANNKQEAIDKALGADGYPSWANTRQSVQAVPLRPYDKSPLKATVGEPQPAGGFTFELGQTDIENRLGWPDQTGDANYEIVNRNTLRPVFLFVANTDQDAQRKYSQIIQAMGMPEDTEDYGYRARGSVMPPIARQAAQSLPQRNYTVRDASGYAMLVQAVNPNAAMQWARENYPNRFPNITDVVLAGSSADLQQQRAQQAASGGSFTGEWKVLLPSGEEVYRFSGIGNSQADANRVAADWLRNNGRGVSGEGFSVVPVMSEGLTESASDYEIHDRHKLDRVLARCCSMVIKGQRQDPERYGQVAACVIDPDNKMIYGINLPGPNGTRRHAERVAIDKYRKSIGDIPAGSIIVTTCSPCNSPMDERYGESCKDLLNSVGIHKVYAGYQDPTQHDDRDADFRVYVTENDDLWGTCQLFAQTFLGQEELAEGLEDYEGVKIKFSKDSDGVAVKALSDDGNKVLGNVELFFNEKGQLEPQDLWVNDRYQGQGIAKAMYDFLKNKGYTVIRSWDQTDAGKGFWDKHRGPEVNVWEQGVAEGSEQSFKVTYDIYGSNKEKPLYTKSRTVRANSEQEAISILRKLVGGTNYRVEKKGVAESTDAKKILNYVKSIHHDFHIDNVILDHPQWQLQRVPLSQLHVPDPESGEDLDDPYNRVQMIDMYHVDDITPQDIESRPIVADTDGHIIDGNHRALAARLRGMKDIPAWVPVKQNVAEIFNQPYKTKTEKSEYGDVDMLARLPDGTNLSIMFNNQGDDEWQVEFYRNNSQEVTGEGDAQRVFATVLAAMQKFIKQHQPWRLIFSAKKEVEPGQNSESRAKLYNSLVRRYANAWGYDEYYEDQGDQVVYELTRKKMMAENFADGKKPGRKGLSKRVGVNTKASVSSLRKTAKHSTGEKARMAHWLANMKAGRARAKNGK